MNQVSNASIVFLFFFLSVLVGVSPVALPRVTDVRVMDAMFVRLLIQEVEHVFDGERERTATIHRAEERLKQIIHKLLQRALQEHIHSW